MTREKADTDLVDSIEAFLKPIILSLEPEDVTGPGRPRILPALALWAGMLVCVARGFSAQLELWRILSYSGLWDFPRYSLSDDAIYRRLKHEERNTFQVIFEKVTQMLRARIGPERAGIGNLASFATGIYALDEMTLDAITKRLPSLRQIPGTVLAGKVTTLFDLRAQLWHHLAFQENATQNEKVAARSMLAYMAPGSLLLADMGYFSFPWFDELTRGGYYWISRVRALTSYTVVHTLFKRDGVLDAIVHLGAYRADMAANAVRLVSFQRNGKTWSYMTNVLDPRMLSLREIGLLYARRWDIEMMFNMVKTHLKLHILWSSHINVVVHQIFAVFTVAQIILGIRAEIATKADADVFEVSLDLMIRWLPRLAHEGLDPIQTTVERGRQAKIIRPSTRIKHDIPDPPLADYEPLPDGVSLTRKPRYAGKP
jgi:hypothetical protein